MEHVFCFNNFLAVEIIRDVKTFNKRANLESFPKINTLILICVFSCKPFGKYVMLKECRTKRKTSGNW